MFSKETISFKTQDYINLHGWFYTPKYSKASMPCIIMTHGFTALKEHYLMKFAEVFVNSGMCVLVYDNRNFGESEGEPRHEVNPELQVRDLSDAITYAQTKPEVDANQIGLWGTSFSGGNVIVAAANDQRVKCLVAQVPFVKGHHEFLKTTRPELWEIIQKKYATDDKARAEGRTPAMTPVVSSDPTKSVVMNQAEAFDFFTSLPEWQNQVTLRSVQMSGDYAPIDWVERIHVPVLFIVAEQDTICLTELALIAFGKIPSIKKCIMIKGHHFAAYHEQFEICVNEASDWFKASFH
jgi:cephalosporin-C deacetylase-like acetyl esterase